MGKKVVSREDAQKVLDLVEELVGEKAGRANGPTLYPADHEGLPEGCWSIAYEGFHGDDPWTILIDRDDVPAGVFVEAMNSWSLGVYPA